MADDYDDMPLRIFQMYPHTDRSLCLMAPTSIEGRFGCYYVQFPERGVPSGGSSWSWAAEQFREPSQTDEILWAQQYLAAKRVRILKADLAEAEADVDALRRCARLVAVQVPA